MSAPSDHAVGARDAGADPALRRLDRPFQGQRQRARARRRLAQPRARANARDRRRIGLRQEHAGTPDRDARDADFGQRRHRRRRCDRRRRGDAARAQEERPDGVPEPVREPQPEEEDRPRAGRAARHQHRAEPGRARGARPRDAGARRPVARALPALSAHVLGRPAPARRDRARADARAAPGDRRRAGVGARRLDPGAGAEPADGPAGIDRRRLRLHLAQPRRGRADRRRGDRHVPRPRHGARAQGRAVRDAAPSLHARAPRQHAARRCERRRSAARAGGAKRARRRAAVAAGAALGLRLSHPLPLCDRALRRGRSAARACRVPRTPPPASARTRSADRRPRRRRGDGYIVCCSTQ